MSYRIITFVVIMVLVLVGLAFDISPRRIL
jgi:hypothetical protein